MLACTTHLIETQEVSIADFCLGSHLTYAAVGKLPLDDYRHIREWGARLDAIEAWQKSAPPMPG